MGECLITRRGRETHKIPILNANFPEDVTTTVIKGDTTSATFTAVIYEPGNPAIYTYQWYVDGVAVEGATGSNFIKDDLAETGTHTIYCEVTNKKGTVTTRIATLEVIQIYTPDIDDIHPKDATVEVDNSVTCNVVISEHGLPNVYRYQWFVNDVAVEDATNDSYTFTPNDNGPTSVYCEVTNDAGTVKSRTATISEFMRFVPNQSAPWSVTQYDVDGYHGAQLTTNDDSTYIKCNSTRSWISGGVISFDATKYSKLKIKCNVALSNHKETGQYLQIGISKTPYGALAVGYAHSGADDFTVDKEYDLSTIDGPVYFMVKYYTTNSGYEMSAGCTITEAVVSE